MAFHILALVIWVVSGIAGWGIAALGGMIVGQVVADSRGKGWGFIWVPIIWLTGAAWAIFALVHSIIEVVAIIVGVVQSSVA